MCSDKEKTKFNKIVGINYLKDGRKIFLIKKEANVIDNYHKELIEKASFINDSIKVILPLAIKKIYNKHHETIDGISVKKK